MAARRQVTAARATVRVLREMGRLEPVDDALVTAFLGLAEAVESSPDNAALWGKYLDAGAALRRVGVDGDPDAIQALLNEITGDGAVRDPSEG